MSGMTAVDSLVMAQADEEVPTSAEQRVEQAELLLANLTTQHVAARPQRERRPSQVRLAQVTP
jgi:hypothetical protein